MDKMGGTMRLGSYQCNVVKDTLLHQIYSNAIIKKDIDIDLSLITTI